MRYCHPNTRTFEVNLHRKSSLRHKYFRIGIELSLICGTISELTSLTMGAKPAAFIITLILQIAFGAASFLLLIVVLNGYNESDATYGIVTFSLLAIAVSVATSLAAASLANRLLARGFRVSVSVIWAVAICSTAGFVLKAISGIMGVAVAEIVRSIS